MHALLLFGLEKVGTVARDEGEDPSVYICILRDDEILARFILVAICSITCVGKSCLAD